ncbi:simple sugar transport system permease protein (plasmid) [Ketogulonicigenium robustum]|uniref:Simple sugar transport system permease protein n=1 Tax=Ketogulonicigenium robustum TaxID=92947 RepID=A0A1W6P311_9RHOB|nr:ABC transporter permease [Ketogulonicigenium robustum]ARO15819.1 simple sugar transport system permease protein [Ketogulonicigenium robustum]
MAKHILGQLAAVVIAFALSAVLILLAGKDPLLAFGAMAQSALGSANGLSETLLRMVPLALCAIGISLSFRAGVFNTGAEGQLYIGGVTAAAIGTALAGTDAFITMPAMILGAAIAGAFWSGIAGALKLRFGADELITTIMLNYIAIFFVGFLLHGPLRADGSALAQTARLTAEARLPVLVQGFRANWGIFLVILAALLASLYLWRRTGGFRLRVVGQNPTAALNAGMNLQKITLGAFLVSGALAGIAGYTEVAGVQRRMIENLSPGYGYTAIIVALLGGTNPIGAVIAAFFFAALQVGASAMESTAGVPSSLASVTQALVVLCLLARNAPVLLRNWLARHTPKTEA